MVQLACLLNIRGLESVVATRFIARMDSGAMPPSAVNPISGIAGMCEGCSWAVVSRWDIRKVALEQIEPLFEDRPGNRGKHHRGSTGDQKPAGTLLRNIDWNPVLSFDDEGENNRVEEVDTIAYAAEGSERGKLNQPADISSKPRSTTADKHCQRRQG